jgi:hypothetical protein
MPWRRHPQNARHPVNAKLHYGCAFAASQVRAKILAIGLGPSIGVMHGNRHKEIALVSDLMESMRPVVDQKILAFAQSQTFPPGDVTINSSGVTAQFAFGEGCCKQHGSNELGTGSDRVSGSVAVSLSSSKSISPASTATFEVAVRLQSVGHARWRNYWATNTKVS